MSDADAMQERLDRVDDRIEDVRRHAESDVPGLDLDPEERYTEHERTYVDSGAVSRADDGEGTDAKGDDQTPVPPG